MNTGTLAIAICGWTMAAGFLAAQTAGVPSAGSKQDETAIREIVKASSAGKPDSRIAADLDWENAFGVRYNDLAKRDKFYKAVVAPLQKDDTGTTLEVKMKFLDATIAEADEYWHIIGQIDPGTGKPGPDRWGRTTYIFKKQNGAWTEILERVADLRAPYYRHYDRLPEPVAVPPETLASYAGAYASQRGKRFAEVAVTGDRLKVTTRQGVRVAIPTSSTDFLVFDPDDLADYLRIQFAKEPDGGFRLALLDATGEKIMDARKSE